MNNHRAKKRFGQNFLTDRNIIDKIISSIQPQPDDHLLEIGPGLGALTRPLLQAAGAVEVIELDRDVIPRLQQNCNQHPGLRIHNADVLKFDFAGSDEPGHKLRVIGNLPYNISTAVLFHLLGFRQRIQDMHFMLQKEVVERIASPPGCHAYGRLSVMMQTFFQTQALFTVPASCFSPAPKVESAVIRLLPHEQHAQHIHDCKQYATLVRTAFSQRRKTLRNTLKPLCTAAQIEAAGIDPGSRAEQLAVTDFVRLYRGLQSVSAE